MTNAYRTFLAEAHRPTRRKVTPQGDALSPGFRVRRAAVKEVEIWGTWTLYFTVLPPEDARSEEANEESPKLGAIGWLIVVKDWKSK